MLPAEKDRLCLLLRAAGSAADADAGATPAGLRTTFKLAGGIGTRAAGLLAGLLRGVAELLRLGDSGAMYRGSTLGDCLQATGTHSKKSAVKHGPDSTTTGTQQQINVTVILCR